MSKFKKKLERGFPNVTFPPSFTILVSPLRTCSTYLHIMSYGTRTLIFHILIVD